MRGKRVTIPGSDSHDPAWSSWLRDAPTLAAPDRLTRMLDLLYAAGPAPHVAERAHAQLHRSLKKAGAPPVYYDRVARTPLGDLLVAISDQGVVAVDFPGSQAEFLQRLRARTGAAALRSARHVAEAARQLRGYLEGERSAFDLAVDLRFLTDFQRQVLLAAAQVPRGQVATYGEIARQIGHPRAARAVGQALGHNPVPIIIPCHRILATDGSLGGYSGRGGLRTKARLLALEGAPVRC